jgi:prepilin-type N-terminal cleavage/methylation domain-containing protein
MDNERMSFGFQISDFRFLIPHSAIHNPQSGMTLIEVILVMVIVGILAAIVVPRTNITIPSETSVNGAANMIASDIRYAQEWAMANRVSKSMTFTNGSPTYTFTPVSTGMDPSGQLQSATITSPTYTLTFNSLGEPTSIPSADPYYVDLAVSAGGLTKTIRIWCFTGKVAISP